MYRNYNTQPPISDYDEDKEVSKICQNQIQGNFMNYQDNINAEDS